ncbi:MAG: hypothetical protein IJG24_03550 [Selenomonadaceae bacterium]|nr:hypothetical protein [Selenomonadaceae bacterium]
MAYTFDTKPVATIKAKITGTADSVTFQGTNPAETNPETAAAQINKILNRVKGKTVTADGMTRTRTEEAIDNG